LIANQEGLPGLVLQLLGLCDLALLLLADSGYAC
jgi:hypothetical protein